jgi:glycine/D-amino acid oxidase-like deaminating enzyme
LFWQIGADEKTTMDDGKRTHGLWAITAPSAPATPPLVGETAANVVIIGAGFTGLSAALHVAEAGRSACVLEAEEIGFGASGRNVGLVNAGLWIKPDDVPVVLDEPFGERLLAQLSDAPSLVFDLIERFGIACEAKRTGTLHCAVGRKGFADIADRASQWRRRGADVALLDQNQASTLIGSTAYAGALLDRRAGTIQPLAYARGLARAALGLGAAIYTRSPVIACEDLGSGWRVTTTQGSVTAPWVIVATDAYSSGFWSGVKREQVMFPYFNLATRPIAPEILQTILPERQGAWDTRTILSSFRLDARGRLVFGSVGALRGPGKRIHADWGQRALRRIFPQLGKVAFDHAWYGMIGMTDDAAPHFHRHARNIVSIGGYSGRGIAPGTTFGRDLAWLACGKIDADALALPLAAVRDAPFRRAKGAFYEVGAQVAHVAGARSRHSSSSSSRTIT